MIVLALVAVPVAVAVGRRRSSSDVCTPVSEIAEGGAVSLRGRAVAGERELVAPLSGRKCVAWSVRVEIHADTGEWFDVFLAHDAVDFALEDGSGRVLVAGSQATLSLAMDEVVTMVFAADLTPAIRAFMADRKLSLARYARRSARFSEGVVALGEELEVHGMVRRRHMTDRRLAMLAIEAGDAQALVVAER